MARATPSSLATSHSIRVTSASQSASNCSRRGLMRFDW